MQARSEYARVLRAVGGLYHLRLASGQEISTKPRGIFRKNKKQILPGDIVGLSYTDSESWIIDSLESRKNVFIRPRVANLDYILVVFSVTEPEPNFILLDKLLAYAQSLSVELVLVFTKSDLYDNSSHELRQEISAYSECGLLNFMVSNKGDSYNDLDNFLESLEEGSLIALVGPSGVGKSSLVNALTQSKTMETAAISQKIQRGKHTTRHVELLNYKQLVLIDTPGFSSLDLNYLKISSQSLIKSYPDFYAQAEFCRFQDCLHNSEPDCAVKDYLISNTIQHGRYERYKLLLKEITEQQY